MNLYRVVQPIGIDKGRVIELTKEQAFPRLHNLKPLKGMKYEVKAEVRFKAGEVIGIELNKTTKAFAKSFEPVEVEAGKKK